MDEKMRVYEGENFYLTLASFRKLVLEYPFIAARGVEDALNAADLKISAEFSGKKKIKPGDAYIRLRIYLNAMNTRYKRAAIGHPDDLEPADERWQM